MKLFRGDTFLRKIVSNNYKLRRGDQFHIAIFKSVYSEKHLYETTIIVQEETDGIVLEIPASKTSELPPTTLILEIELTTVNGIVKTDQYELEIEADGIYERN